MNARDAAEGRAVEEPVQELVLPLAPAGQRVHAPGTWLFVLPWELHHAGGINQVVRHLFDANQSELGGRSLLLVMSWVQGDISVRTVDGRRTAYARMRAPWQRTRSWRTLASFIAALPGALRRFSRLLRCEGVAWVNVHNPDLPALLWTVLLPLMRPRPQLLLSFHGADLAAAVQARGAERWCWRRQLAGADQIVVCSSALREQLLRNYPSTAGRVRVIDNGVDPAVLRRLAAEQRLVTRPTRYLLSLGTLEHKKGHDLTLHAFAVLAAQDPTLHLVIAGRAEAELDRLETLRRRLPFGDRVQLRVDLDHAVAMAWLKDALALVLASRIEPFGIVVLEAGVFSRPVIATATCGVARRLRPGEDLLVVPAEDADALAEGIGRVLGDAALAARLGESLRATVERDFNWSRIVRDYASALQA